MRVRLSGSPTGHSPTPTPTANPSFVCSPCVGLESPVLVAFGGCLHLQQQIRQQLLVNRSIRASTGRVNWQTSFLFMARSQCFFGSGPLSLALALRPASPPPHPNSSTVYLCTQPRSARLHLTTRPAVETATIDGGGGARVYVVSDLHTDYSENMSWLNSLPNHNDGQNVLLVAGDVAETYQNFLVSMSILKEKFDRVFFVPGNHDLWLRRDKIDCLGSLDKLDKLLDACQILGVETKPSIVDGLGIIPLYSWYHESFDEERDITGIRIPSLAMVINFLSPSM